MNQNQQQWVDILTGMGMLSGQIYNVKSKKKKVTGSFFDAQNNSEGDFLIKTNKKGNAKFTKISYEDDEMGIYSQFKWKKLNSNKFGRNAANEYREIFLDALDSNRKGDLQGFIDSFEMIPGAGDLEIKSWGLGSYLVWD